MDHLEDMFPINRLQIGDFDKLRTSAARLRGLVARIRAIENTEDITSNFTKQ